jgi:hypothetical protein
MADLKCSHCGQVPTDAIAYAFEDCGIGDAFGQLTECDHCDGEIEVQVSREAWVQRRGSRHSNAELERLRAEKESTALSVREEGK